MYVLKLSFKVEHQHVISCRVRIILKYYICAVYQAILKIQCQDQCGTVFIMPIHTKLTQKFSVGWELLNESVISISHIEDTIIVNGDTKWPVEGAFAITHFPKF